MWMMKPKIEFNEIQLNKDYTMYAVVDTQIWSYENDWVWELMNNFDNGEEFDVQISSIDNDKKRINIKFSKKDKWWNTSGFIDFRTFEWLEVVLYDK